jgi:hypothetical protein
VKGQTKEIALIGLMAALCTVQTGVVPVVSLFVFSVFSLSLKLVQATSMGAIIGAIGALTKKILVYSLDLLYNISYKEVLSCWR